MIRPATRIVGSSRIGSSSAQPYIYRQNVAHLRSFSSSTRNDAFMDTLSQTFNRIRDPITKRLGGKTSDEKKVDAVKKEMRARPERTRARQLRKRWGAPKMVEVNPSEAKVNLPNIEGPGVKHEVLGRSKAFKTGDTVLKERITEHKYSTAAFRISPRKLKVLADQIGEGKPIDYAILQMQFSHKQAARRIRSTLCLARDHAIAKGLDPSKLVVSEAWVGKGSKFKKMEPKGRARTGVRTSFQSRLSIVLREGKTWTEKQARQLEKEKKRIRSIGTGGVVRTNRPIVNTYQRPGWQW